MFSERLIIVTGKGGVGKSALASAIALRGSRSRPTVLVTTETHETRHPFLEVPLGYEPVPARPGLAVCRVEGLAAVREYVRRKVPFAGVYDAFLRSRTFRDFAEAAPGFEELMCLGKIYDLATGADFQQVVFDAPSTGHFRSLMDVPAATLDAVRVGPLNHNARRIQDLLLDPERTAVVVVALAEEMAVREATELESFCRKARMGFAGVFVNQSVEARFRAAELEALDRLADTAPELVESVRVVRAEAALAASQKEALELFEPGMRPVKVPRFIDYTPAALIEHIAAVFDDF